VPDFCQFGFEIEPGGPDRLKKSLSDSNSVSFINKTYERTSRDILDYIVYHNYIAMRKKTWKELILSHLCSRDIEMFQVIAVQLNYPDSTSTRSNNFIYRASYNNACNTANVINP
jgi:hypothetical protein